MLQKMLYSTGMNRIFFGLLLLAAISCKSAHQGAQQPIDHDAVAREELGSFSSKVENKTNTHILYVRKEKEVGMLEKKRFLVLDKSTGAVTIKPMRLNGKVTWHDDERLLINPMNRVPPDKDGNLEDNSYLINVKTNKRSTRGITEN